MRIRITPHRFSGVVKIPPSKSHTIRQLFIASLADGVSEIHNPLDSLDTRSCVDVCRALGAEITETRDGEKLLSYTVIGNFHHRVHRVFAGNSGTAFFFALAVASLQAEPVEITGDEQIQKRSAAPLLEALAGLGVQSHSNNGFAPITIKGPWANGSRRVSLPCPTSQYLSAMLIASPMAADGSVTEIEVPLLNEKPYIDMTLSYLTAHSIPFENHDYSRFVIPGGSAWKAFCGTVPGDYSSAAFPAAAAAITGGDVTLLGLDPFDTQGDRFFFGILKKMGCDVIEGDLSVVISRKAPLIGGTFDLNATPDLLPAAAAVAAYAEGDTALVNVAHARIKETDRIAVMAKELLKFGVSCTELPDGLVIHGRGQSSLSASIVDGCGDHRVTMALAAIALGCKAPVEILNADRIGVSYPGFMQLFERNPTPK